MNDKDLVVLALKLGYEDIATFLVEYHEGIEAPITEQQAQKIVNDIIREMSAGFEFAGEGVA